MSKQQIRYVGFALLFSFSALRAMAEIAPSLDSVAAFKTVETSLLRPTR